MAQSVLSVDVSEELVINLPADCADTAYRHLSALPSRVLDGITRLLIAAPLRSLNQTGYLFKCMPCLRALHIQHSDVCAEDIGEAELYHAIRAYDATCTYCFELVHALVRACRPRTLSIDIPISSDAEARIAPHVWFWPESLGGRHPEDDLLRTAGVFTQHLAFNLGCSGGGHPDVLKRMHDKIDRWCTELLEPPEIRTYKRRLRYASTTGFAEDPTLVDDDVEV